MTSGEEREPASLPDDAEAVGPLPEPVRARIVALAADALGRMPAEHLPAPLKRVAAFAPGRRAKLAGTQIASVLETDTEFRARVAAQVRAEVSEVAQAIEAAGFPSAADPVEVASVAYLLRPEGWRALVEEALRVIGAGQDAQATQVVAEQSARLRRQVESAAEELKAARQRHREETSRLKTENVELRQKLGDARAKAKEASLAAEEALASAADGQRAVDAVAAQGESEVRRLRARIEELEGEIAAVRRAGRVGRDSGTLRARLLLDTLLDAAQGLRRELALPATEGAPADRVEADVAERGTRESGGHRSLAGDDPAVLDALLGLPRVHLIVDGYNVTKQAWPDLPLEKQRDRLLNGLAPLAARSGAEVTVVFDAAEQKDRPLVNRPRGVRVLYSPLGVIADDIIRDLVAAEPQGRPLVVVSSDDEVVRDVTRLGARAVASAALARLLARA